MNQNDRQNAVVRHDGSAVFAAWLLSSCCLLACGGSVPQSLAPQGRGERPSPLGASYVLQPLPSDDDGILGRILDRPPEAGQSLEEIARPNPCAEKLAETRTVPSLASFEDAEELAMSGKASATLGAYGFAADASRATHFVYKLQTEKRESKLDTSEYAACCQEKGGCGYGFVSALVYGSGEYSTAEETTVGAQANVAFAKAEGTASLRILHTRNVRGWVAVLIRVTDAAKAGGAGVATLGDPAALGIKLDEATLSGQVKDRFAAGKIAIEPLPNDPRPESAYKFRDAAGPIDENTFIERYRGLVGPSELDRLEGRRNAGAKYGTIGLMVLGVAMAGAGAYFFATAEDDQTKQLNGGKFVAGISGLTLGASGLIGGILLATFAWGADETGDHRITKFDAELYAQRYNRTLLRKTVHETQDRMRSLSRLETTPTVGAPSRGMNWSTVVVTPLGIAGTF